MANVAPTLGSDAARLSKNDGGFGVPTRTWKTVSGGIAVWVLIALSYALGLYLTLFGVGASINPPSWLPVAAGAVALALGALLIPIGLSFIVVRDSDVASRRTLHWRREAAKRLNAITEAVGTATTPTAGSLHERLGALEEQSAAPTPSAPHEDQLTALTNAVQTLDAERDRLKWRREQELTFGERLKVLYNGKWPR